MQTWEFSAIDTLFFRESRPMESPGSSELGSVFPPPPRTLAGAIRSHIGESMGVDWQAFEQSYKDKTEDPVRNKIGYGDDFAEQFQLQGVWIHYKGERLYPAPLNLMVKRDNETQRDKITEIDYLSIGAPCECDLGKNLRLACLPENMQGSKPLSNHWLTAAGFQEVLSGDTPEPDKDIIGIQQLREEEPRLGIARDNRSRVVKEGMLYQTRHIRLNADTRLSLDITGLDNAMTSNLVKLGGEGRMANIQPVKKPHAFAPLSLTGVDQASIKGIVLYLLTPMLLPEDSDFLPGFNKHEEPDKTFWKGTLKDTTLKLISSIIGKVQREGGWDMAKHKPRPVQSLIPSGSVFYCEVGNGDIEAAIKNLHGQQIGLDQHLGRGHLAVGLWRVSETKGSKT